MYITYILISLVKPKTYTGHTKNLAERLKQHNAGQTEFTKKFSPWKILYTEEFKTEYDSIRKEKYFKSAAGRRWLKKKFFS